MSKRMKYYVYISDSKLAMLYDQLPRGFLAWFRRASVSVGPVGGGIEGHLERTRSDRLQRVLNSLHKQHKVGTVDEPKEYFAGVLDMRLRPIPYPHNVIFFGGESEHTIVGLGGSMHHLIGSAAQLSADALNIGPTLAASGAPAMVDALGAALNNQANRTFGEVEKEFLSQQGGFRWDYQVESVVRINQTPLKFGYPAERLEFFAKKLLVGKSDEYETEPKQVLLGTPLYVAKAD